jgi:hypothetical protein
VVAALQQPLRTALAALDTANFEADQSLRGAGVNATGDMPTGWARELWTHAFAATVWSGDLTLLMDARETYSGAPIDYQRFEARRVQLSCIACAAAANMARCCAQPFIELKKQDFEVGGSGRIDAVEWRAMALARDDPDVAALSKPGCQALEAQRAMDRFIAYAREHSADEGAFQVNVALKSDADRMRERGMKATHCSIVEARMQSPVFLEVWATQVGSERGTVPESLNWRALTCTLHALRLRTAISIWLSRTAPARCAR